MATLKEHQAAMVDLLANGSGIPASASRLAHAMHDVLEALSAGVIGRHGFGAWDNKNDRPVIGLANDATTPGLNDKALSKREKALKTDSPAKWPTPAEQRVKELENTIRQLKANNAKLKSQNEDLRDDIGAMASKLHTAEKHLGLVVPDQPKCACLPEYYEQCEVCGPPEVEQAGCRKCDTQLCGHHNVERIGGELICCDCGAKR